MAEKDRRVQSFGQPFDAAQGKPFDGSTELTASPAQGKQHRPDPSSAAADSPLPLQRVDILRAKDIIPGAVREDSISRVDIPQFDLAEDIMAEQRRLSAIRRKGPDSPAQIPVATPQLSSDLPPPSRYSDDRGAFERIGAGWDPIIESIVARDIERLCAGGS
jgi:hypothetical protein